MLDTTTVPNGMINVELRNKAQIDGRFFNVTSASIDGDSTWLMSGDSTVGHLALGSTGTVALGNGSTFNTLTVDTFDGPVAPCCSTPSWATTVRPPTS